MEEGSLLPLQSGGNVVVRFGWRPVAWVETGRGGPTWAWGVRGWVYYLYGAVGASSDVVPTDLGWVADGGGGMLLSGDGMDLWRRVHALGPWFRGAPFRAPVYQQRRTQSQTPEDVYVMLCVPARPLCTRSIS